MLKVELIFCQFNFFSYLCITENKSKIINIKNMDEKFVTELKQSIKNRGFIECKDFISIDGDEYYVLLPFVFEILHPFCKYEEKDASISNQYSKVLAHCLTHEKKYFIDYYEKQFLELHRLKCFFFNKTAKIIDMQQNAIDCRKPTLCEFTCWLDENDENIHLFHNFYNRYMRDDSDKIIYDKASIIINKLKQSIFDEFKKYDYNSIVENYKLKNYERKGN